MSPPSDPFFFVVGLVMIFLGGVSILVARDDFMDGDEEGGNVAVAGCLFLTIGGLKLLAVSFA